MRLSFDQQSLIRRIIVESLGAQTRVWLFGLRTDDQAQGDDIDLLAETPGRVSLGRVRLATVRLEQNLGIPVDVLTTSPEQPDSPMVNIARLTGIALA